MADEVETKNKLSASETRVSEVQQEETDSTSLTAMTVHTPLPRSLAVPLVGAADAGPNVLYGLQQIYQPPANCCFASLGLLPQAIPQLTSTPTVFSCDGATFVDGHFPQSSVLSSESALFGPIQPRPVRLRRRPQAGSHEDTICTNCNTTKTSLWRRNELGQMECNACNLYYRKNKRPRPLSLCKDTIAKRKRKSNIQNNEKK